MAWYDALAGIGDFLSGLFKTGYDVYQDQRDTQYQHELQQTIFNREDNAVQRRIADLQAAGLNPNLAAGSAAGAGSVVGRSAAHNVSDPGSALDMVAAVNQIKNQREQNSILRQQEHYNETQNKLADQALALQQMEWLSQLGFRVQPFMDTRTNKLGYFYDGNRLPNMIQPNGVNLINLNNELAARNMLNSATMLQFDTDFYRRHQIFKNFVQPIISTGLEGGATAARMYAAFGPK